LNEVTDVNGVLPLAGLERRILEHKRAPVIAVIFPAARQLAAHPPEMHHSLYQKENVYVNPQELIKFDMYTTYSVCVLNNVQDDA
jgi:hypothetical protein